MLEPGDKVIGRYGWEGCEGRVTFSCDEQGRPMILVTHDGYNWMHSSYSFTGAVISSDSNYWEVVVSDKPSDLHEAIDTILPFV